MRHTRKVSGNSLKIDERSYPHHLASCCNQVSMDRELLLAALRVLTRGRVATGIALLRMM